jgi:hypothetical protein
MRVPRFGTTRVAKSDAVALITAQRAIDEQHVRLGFAIWADHWFGRFAGLLAYCFLASNTAAYTSSNEGIFR